MANALYENGKSNFLKKQIDMVNDSISAVLVKNTYTFSQAHLTYAASVQSHQAATPVVLANKTVSADGTFDADDVTFPTVAGGSTVSSVVLYHTTSGILIGYIDTGTGLPIATNGGDIVINWSNAATKIFKL